MPEFVVGENFEGINVQSFLRKHCSVSARLLSRLKRTENGITRNGEHVRSIDILHSGDVVEISFPQDDINITPVEMPLDIVYEDSEIIVINKPPYMPVHPVHDHQLDTLANAVIFYSRQKGENYAFRAVNRLDRDTSGLVLIAKTGYAHTYLAKHTEKLYTAYKAVKYMYGHTLLELSLETGRTHQIRTHLSSIGHPLAGDDMYGGSLEFFQRQCLHCSRLISEHPITHEKLTLNKPPEDWFEEIRKKIL